MWANRGHDVPGVFACLQLARRRRERRSHGVGVSQGLASRAEGGAACYGRQRRRAGPRRCRSGPRLPAASQKVAGRAGERSLDHARDRRRARPSDPAARDSTWMMGLPEDPIERAAYVGRFRDALMCAADLPAGAKVVGFGILAHVNWQSGEAWPSMTRLAKLLQFERSTVVRAVAKLVEGRWFIVETGVGKRSSRYRINPLRVPHVSPISDVKMTSLDSDGPPRDVEIAPPESANYSDSCESGAMAVSELHASGLKLTPKLVNGTYRNKQPNARARESRGKHHAEQDRARHTVNAGGTNAPRPQTPTRRNLNYTFRGGNDKQARQAFASLLGREALETFDRSTINWLFNRFYGGSLEPADIDKAWSEHGAADPEVGNRQAQEPAEQETVAEAISTPLRRIAPKYAAADCLSADRSPPVSTGPDGRAVRFGASGHPP